MKTAGAKQDKTRQFMVFGSTILLRSIMATLPDILRHQVVTSNQRKIPESDL